MCICHTQNKETKGPEELVKTVFQNKKPSCLQSDQSYLSKTGGLGLANNQPKTDFSIDFNAKIIEAFYIIFLKIYRLYIYIYI